MSLPVLEDSADWQAAVHRVAELHTNERLTLAFSDFPLVQSEVPVTLL